MRRGTLSIAVASLLLTSCSLSDTGKGTMFGPQYERPAFRFTSPKGGESFCMGEKTLIAWEGDESIQTIRIILVKKYYDAGTISGWMTIQDFPLNFKDGKQQENGGRGEYIWTVGETKSKEPVLEDGAIYSLGTEIRYKEIDANRSNGFAYKSDDVFSIKNCN